MTSERLLNTSIKVLYLPRNFYTSPKQISGYAPDRRVKFGLKIGKFMSENLRGDFLTRTVVWVLLWLLLLLLSLGNT